MSLSPKALFYLIILFALASCNSSGSRDNFATPAQTMAYQLKGTLTTHTGDPLMGIEVTLPQRGLKTRTNESGGFSFNFESDEAAARDLQLTIRHPQKQSDFTLDISAYPEVPIRADFIYDETNSEIFLEGLTPDPGIIDADDATVCTVDGNECAASHYCFFIEGDCGQNPGVCLPVPEACTLIFSPVCGCDGNTYGNDCAAATKGVSVKSFGECEA